MRAVHRFVPSVLSRFTESEGQDRDTLERKSGGQECLRAARAHSAPRWSPVSRTPRQMPSPGCPFAFPPAAPGQAWLPPRPGGCHLGTRSRRPGRSRSRLSALEGTPASATGGRAARLPAGRRHPGPGPGRAPLRHPSPVSRQEAPATMKGRPPLRSAQWRGGAATGEDLTSRYESFVSVETWRSP